MADLTEYKRVLEKLANTESKEYINNSSMDHAATMIEVLFNNSKGLVCILSDHLHGEVYDRTELKKCVEDFFKRDENNMIDVIMQLNVEPDEKKLLQNGFVTFLDQFKDRVRLFKAIDENLKSLKNHYMIARTTKDNFAFRFELDTNDHIATGTFNDENRGEKLYNYFTLNTSNPNNTTLITKYN